MDEAGVAPGRAHGNSTESAASDKEEPQPPTRIVSDRCVTAAFDYESVVF